MSASTQQAESETAMSTNATAGVATPSTNATAGVATPSTDATASVATPSTNATRGVATPQTSDDNTALIGGIVGGIAALLLVGGLIAFLVARNRRNVNEQDNNKTMANTTATSTAVSSNYDRIPTTEYNYIRIGVEASSRNHYDALTPTEL
jgi:hypothetical protein